MNLLKYFADNVPLFCICAVMLYLAIRRIRTRKKESIYFIIFTAIVLFLSIIVFLEKYSQYYGYITLGTISTALGYITRPILLYVFVLLSSLETKTKNKIVKLLAIPLILPIIIYTLAVFRVTNLAFYYEANSDGTASFVRGGFLNFTSHIVCLGYLAYLVYISTVRFHGKHRRDGLVIVLCVFIILLTVGVEMITGRNDLLNIVCEICALVNYIFINSVNTSKDPLTDLYDRRTYYEDISKFKNLVNGIVQIDMNGLKYLNDNYGHKAGDDALASIASILQDSIDKRVMCVYRLSGDEFLILMFDGKKAALDEVVEIINKKMNESSYSIALGSFYYDRNADITYEQALKTAEELMYKNKSDYYKTSGIDRRKN